MWVQSLQQAQTGTDQAPTHVGQPFVPHIERHWIGIGAGIAEKPVSLPNDLVVLRAIGAGLG